MPALLYLPASLDHQKELPTLRRQLEAREVQLDWTDTRDASDAALQTLLGGLSRIHFTDVLGLDTLHETLQDAVLGALDFRPFRPPRPPAQESVLKAPSPQALRSQLEALVLNDLLGPAGGPEEEVHERSVTDRYLVGMLAPRRTRIAPEEHDSFSVEGDDTREDGRGDVETPQAESLVPSSVGLTFCVAGEATSFRVTVRWGHYRRADSAYALNDNGNPKRVWKREPCEGQVTAIRVREGNFGPVAPCLDQPHVQVRGVIRRNNHDFVVSLFLVNAQDEPERNRDEAWVFQPELRVDSVDGSAIFRRRLHRRDPRKLDEKVWSEEQGLAMLYRRQVEFAVGHGVAVHADPLPGDPTQATRLEIRPVPCYEVPAQEPPTRDDLPGLEGLILDMRTLAELDDASLIKTLRILPKAYVAWIDAEQAQIQDPAQGLAPFADAAHAALKRCRFNLERMREGLTVLEHNPMAAEAFRFANQAMALQRIHSLQVERVRRELATPIDPVEALDVPRNRTWRTFQLAFILLNLPALADLQHPDRVGEEQAMADLLWFPTGGGKTEAYLGLTAFALAMRRLQGPVEDRVSEQGVAVLMRYTLRVLTLQQFQRAATLISACETLRRAELREGTGRWGTEPFRVGLWVGQATTPNRTAQSEEWHRLTRDRQAKGSHMAGVGSPAQLTNCPWCGQKLEPGRDITVEPFERGAGRTLVYCGSGACEFSRRLSPGEGIPVMVVDEEIYRHPPALLIATVDKFAQMPWQGPIQTLFGQVAGHCSRHGFRSPDLEDAGSHPKLGHLPAARTTEHPLLRPPDLIIQDELHLISGPLGSLVGLYETAVDALCAWHVGGKRVRPKVIASTATVRHAEEQVHALFLRRLNVFPPHGTRVEDNFFSVQRAPERLPGRRYMGICAPGRRLKSVLIRVYVAWLGAAQRLYTQYGLAVDPWMTLVGYFNAMRELAGQRRLVDDEIRSRLRDAERRGLGRRPVLNVEELTSRKNSTDIPRLLDHLEQPFDPVEEAARKEQAQSGPSKKPRPLDVLLATNMISVGVDVKRFGLMVVAGQPKTTAEYIQATSRVGRSSPGLVCTVYNWARPRDLSHYEQFEQYHATFYQHVEALSVTPFASRAIDRGLPGVLVAMVRLGGQPFNPNEGAAQIKQIHPLVKRALEQVAWRARLVTQSQEAGKDVEKRSKKLLDHWLHQAQMLVGSRLGYKEGRDGRTRPLLKSAGLGLTEPFVCLNSLRDVEPTVSLVLEDFGMDVEPGASVPADMVGEQGGEA